MIEEIYGVSVVHWNPLSRRLPRPFGRIRFGGLTNNFGDILGPMLVKRILEINLLNKGTSKGSDRLLTVGSILHFAEDSDVIWGSGVNGKEPLDKLLFSSLDIRSVRGPRTRQILLERGIEVLEVFGDPALLTPQLFPELSAGIKNKVRQTAFVPNLHDEKDWKALPGLVSPRGLPEKVISEIVQSEQVITSSLHGFIIAEAYGIPVQLVAPKVENNLKYLDYIEGTGRSHLNVVPTIEDAIRFLKEGSLNEMLDFNSKDLLSAFPLDLWSE